MSTLISIFVLFLLIFHTLADPPKAKSERDWKDFLRAKRFDQGQSLLEVEKRLDSRVALEFDSDHGFALLHDVYYALDSEWYAIAAYRSPGGANAIPNPSGAERAKMLLIAVPQLVRNTPEFQAHMERVKSLRP